MSLDISYVMSNDAYKIYVFKEEGESLYFLFQLQDVLLVLYRQW